MSSPPCCLCGNPGETRCRCRQPALVFCMACNDSHVKMGHAMPDAAVPINSGAGPINSGAVPAAYTYSSDTNLEYTRMLLITNLEEVQRVRTEAASTFNGLIQSVYMTKLRVDAELAQVIGTLSSYVEHYATHVFGNLVLDRLRTTLGPKQLSEKLSLLSWSKSTEEFETHLKYAFVFAANTFLFNEDAPEVVVTQRAVPIFQKLWEAFDVEYGSKSNITCKATRTLQNCSVWIHTSETQVMICGDSSSKNAYLFDYSTSDFQPLNPQLFIHYQPGLGLKNGYIYCFGGSWRDIQQRYCERYEETTGQWVAIPTMQFPRSSFTPALEGNVFYLIGGWSCSTCETFDTISQSFQTQNFEMGHTGACLSFVYDGDVIILMNGHLSVWEKKTDSECPRSYGKWGDFTLLITVPPYRSGDRAYMIGFTKSAVGLYELDLSTKQISEKTSQFRIEYV